MDEQLTADAEIAQVAIAYIRRHCMNLEEWKFTALGALHTSLNQLFQLDAGEHVLVSSHRSSDSWYVFTTRRIVSVYQGQRTQVDPRQEFECDFGNFKGYEGRKAGLKVTEIGTITTKSDTLTFEFETLYASMAPIYACRFWQNRKGVTWRHQHRV